MGPVKKLQITFTGEFQSSTDKNFGDIPRLALMRTSSSFSQTARRALPPATEPRAWSHVKLHATHNLHRQALFSDGRALRSPYISAGPKRWYFIIKSSSVANLK